MWGEVTPAERLRSVTRRGVDDDRLAAAAADALAGFSDEPASLVVACRRVLAHHRAHGQLWWVCSRILAAADAAAAAHTAVQELEGDRTGDRLGATLPLLDEGEVVADRRLHRRRSTTRCSSASTSTRSRFGSTATIPSPRSGGAAAITRCASSTSGTRCSNARRACSCRPTRSGPTGRSFPRAPPTCSTRSVRRARGLAGRRSRAGVARAGVRDDRVVTAGRRVVRGDLAPAVRSHRGSARARTTVGRGHASTARWSPNSCVR